MNKFVGLNRVDAVVHRLHVNEILAAKSPAERQEAITSALSTINEHSKTTSWLAKHTTQRRNTQTMAKTAERLMDFRGSRRK